MDPVTWCWTVSALEVVLVGNLQRHLVGHGKHIRRTRRRWQQAMSRPDEKRGTLCGISKKHVFGDFPRYGAEGSEDCDEGFVGVDLMGAVRESQGAVDEACMLLIGVDETE